MIVEVRGPGHHDRAEAAARLIAAVASHGEVMVETTLRPRLAVDVEALLDAGAAGVTLDGPASRGVFCSTGGSEAAPDPAAIVVRLVADAAALHAVVLTPLEPGSAAESVHQAIVKLGLTPQPA